MSSTQKHLSKLPKISDDKDEDRKFKHFLVEFISCFMEKLDLISLTVDKKIPIGNNLLNYRKVRIINATSRIIAMIPVKGSTVTADLASNANPTVKVALDCGETIKDAFSHIMQKIADSTEKKQLYKIVNNVTPGSEETNLAIAMIACELAMIFEAQIRQPKEELDHKYYKRLAQDIVHGMLQ